jgi:osmotically-inducible protein OsmY
MSPGYQGTLSSDLNEHSKRQERPLTDKDILPSQESSNPGKDEKIRSRIESTIHGHTEFDSSRVKVMVKNATVTLSGLVDSSQSKATIEGLTESVDDVEEVVSLIHIDNISSISKSMSGQDDLIL